MRAMLLLAAFAVAGTGAWAIAADAPAKVPSHEGVYIIVTTHPAQFPDPLPPAEDRPSDLAPAVVLAAQSQPPYALRDALQLAYRQVLADDQDASLAALEEARRLATDLNAQLTMRPRLALEMPTLDQLTALCLVDSIQDAANAVRLADKLAAMRQVCFARQYAGALLSGPPTCAP